MTAALVDIAAEYLALGIARRMGASSWHDADRIAAIVGLPPEHVDRLILEKDLAAFAGRRRFLDDYTQGRPS